MRSATQCLAACMVTISISLSQAAAQETASTATVDVESVRAVLISGFEQYKEMDVEFARAIPDSALRWAPTSGVRDFAQQIEHGALDNAFFVARGVLGTETPTFGDSAVYLNDKEALAEAVAEVYDYVLESLRNISAEDLAAEADFFRRRLPRWRIYLLALQHANWTRGQLVPYFRLNGMDPPRWRSY